MRARRFARRLVGLPLFGVLVLGASPALAAVVGTASPTSGQGISTGSWAMVFTGGSATVNGDGSITVGESGGTLVTLSNLTAGGNTSRPIPASFHTRIALTSSDSTSMGAYLCSVPWTTTGLGAPSCSGTQTQIGNTSTSTLFMSGQAIPAAYSAQVKIGPTGLGSLGGKVTVSVTVTAI